MTMEEDVLGVPEFYMSDHVGFFGTIKNSTKDFVVTEIDIHGQLVTQPASSTSEGLVLTPDVTAPPACPKKREGRAKRGPQEIREDTLRDVGEDVGPSLNGDGDGGDTNIPSQDVFDLSLLLGPSVSEELEQFTAALREARSTKEREKKKMANREDDTMANQVCDKMTNQGDNKMANRECDKMANREEDKVANQELSLGLFPDKHQRANVHRAVRHNFPFLMTVTNQSEICVRGDPAYRELAGLVTEEEAEDFFRFIDAKVPNAVYTFRPDACKEHRTSVHHFLSRRFGKLVETKSFAGADPQTPAITVRLRGRGPGGKRTADHCRAEEVYTAFTLRKENLETLEAVSSLAGGLGVLPSDFSYAGVKDKRAVTYQTMVVHKVSALRLREKACEFERRGMVLSQVRPASEPLHLGRLRGNHFDLVVRALRPHLGGGADVDLGRLVQEAVENTKVRGFVNYYGPQRFGTGQSVQSDRIGLALLREDMVSAVRLFFTPEEGDDPQSRAKRHYLQTDNAKEALSLMPVYKARERLMLRALHRYGGGAGGCARAWLSLPHAARVFYPHAYCSRVWNQAAAHRLATLGARPREGDLVWARAAGRQGVEVEGVEEPGLPQIHVISAAEEEEGVYTLAEVVLPMPGNTVSYPGGEVGAWYQDRLAQDGLAGSRFRVSALKLNLPGCYRPLVALPRNLTYTLHGLGGERGGG